VSHFAIISRLPTLPETSFNSMGQMGKPKTFHVLWFSILSENRGLRPFIFPSTQVCFLKNFWSPFSAFIQKKKLKQNARTCTAERQKRNLIFLAQLIDSVWNMNSPPRESYIAIVFIIYFSMFFDNTLSTIVGKYGAFLPLPLLRGK
jgi:hypothetical protein